MALDQYLSDQLALLEAKDLLRVPDDGAARAVAEAASLNGGHTLIDASSNDYLGLAGLSVSRETLGTRPVSTGSGASRLIHGTRPSHSELEAELASWVRLPTALLFTSGYAANAGTLAALGAPGTVILSDALNHASLIDGCRLSRAEVRVVTHLDLDALAVALGECSSARQCWVVTESYFSMDGDGPNLLALRALCERAGAALVVDEAHALGVFGPEGAGRCAEAGVSPDVLVGTLGKATGVQGAFVAGSTLLRQVLWNRARSFVFSTAPSPALSELCLLHVKQTRRAAHARERLHENGAQLRGSLAEQGLLVAPGSFGPIVPVLIGENRRALEASSTLASQGILTQAIRPPTVPAGTARLRLTVTSKMSPEQIARLGSAVASALDPTRVESPQPVTRQRRPQRVVVLGTGTSVGKTYFAAALCRALRDRRGNSVLGLKPVESGVDGAIGADAQALASASGREPVQRFSLPAPVSPHLAAERAGLEIRIDELRAFVAMTEAADDTLHYVVIETAGGVFSPLSAGSTNFDLALALEPAIWVLVAPDSLGVLHDVSATLAAMRYRGRPPDHVVLSLGRGSDASTGTNASELTRLGLVEPVASLRTGDAPELEALLAQLL